MLWIKKAYSELYTDCCRQSAGLNAVSSAVMLTWTGHARTRTMTKSTRTRTRTRTSFTVTYCKLHLNLQSLSSNNNEHRVKIHNIGLKFGPKGSLRIWLIRLVQPANRIERRDLVFALKTHKTIMFHEIAPNLVNVHFPTQDQSFGTSYPCTSALNQTLRVSRTFLGHTFLDSHLTY